MAYKVLSGELVLGVLYYISGSQSVIYDSSIYNSGLYFRAGTLKTYSYTGVGSQEVNEVAEIRGLALEYFEIRSDQPNYNESTIFKGFSLEYDLNEAEKTVNETTKIQSCAIELTDYPFFALSITEKRL
ncbi:hypothetical protein GWR56_11125 [Mucilaginibacter sp. 14171R-50]|uniref:hypothetical protein n=1 Tax=Mucilaginibacter sp. 14171R-50 TaxID=2703789 RepID=UPI00138C9EA4|nr:hypothetical protein [Mucilaginibacter sp. 14171R-50]QHS56057.1 hypothetical protein GWR56_11125 [Mucilaginibacter sp. 14171R-50]